MARHKGSPHRNSDTITVIGGSPVRMCAVYAIRTNDGPTRIWYALKTGGLIEPGSDQKIVAIGWAPELKPARRVAKRCHRLLIQAGRNIATPLTIRPVQGRRPIRDQCRLGQEGDRYRRP